AGPMHRVPQLQWKTWVRLAFVEAGSDWRSLNRLAVEDGQLRDNLQVPEMHRGGSGVRRWDDAMGVVASASRPSNGAFSVADPRFAQSAAWNDGHAYGVTHWGEPSSTVTSKLAPGSGYGSVADPRTGVKHNNCFLVVRMGDTSPSVTGGAGPSAGGLAVADPRQSGAVFGKYAVTQWQDPAGTVISGSTTGQGAFAVADPRAGMDPQRGAYRTGGHYGVVPWDAASGAVPSAACHDSGRWSVADPRVCDSGQVADEGSTGGAPAAMPAADEKLVAVIRAEDGTWHRPFTTLELAALQSLVDPEEQLELDGLSDSAWRERIGNAVPPQAAEAIAHVMGTTLLLAWSGETFILSAQPIWVRPIALGLTLPQREAA
ncbi:MAG: DNA cytosine methyltransferase, partial [Methylibium sp.]